eukprot:CAMPEP_0119166340 /NCGR_PEP_ID=MMETSP1315-20130426/5788_1 /TAXON_ID=676789 /ORGANISM="Prasinoderma singularis, Strain RCC927" /LENGTH=207 /DNA_ID=CAMNT_0007159715 /DNA_START=158 /DNA_END=781 /DNA_ORIENTATION=-
MRCRSSPVDRLLLQVVGNLRLPPVAVGQQLLLVVQQLLVRLCRKLGVGALDNGVHGARLLAEPAIDALGHVDVVARGATATVLPLLGLDCDGLRGADGLAQLARNAALLAAGVAAQCVLAAEAGAQRRLLKGVVDGELPLEEVLERHAHAARNLRQHIRLGLAVEHLKEVLLIANVRERLAPGVGVDAGRVTLIDGAARVAARALGL